MSRAPAAARAASFGAPLARRRCSAPLTLRVGCTRRSATAPGGSWSRLSSSATIAQPSWRAAELESRLSEIASRPEAQRRNRTANTKRTPWGRTYGDRASNCPFPQARLASQRAGRRSRQQRFAIEQRGTTRFAGRRRLPPQASETRASRQAHRQHHANGTTNSRGRGEPNDHQRTTTNRQKPTCQACAPLEPRLIETRPPLPGGPPGRAAHEGRQPSPIAKLKFGERG